jgi:hypothetical protein
LIICVKTNWSQQQSFNKATKDERAKLEEKYPVGNYPQFPDLRVYRDARTGFYYELNTMRSGVWASAMVCSFLRIRICFEWTNRLKAKRTRIRHLYPNFLTRISASRLFRLLLPRHPHLPSLPSLLLLPSLALRFPSQTSYLHHFYHSPAAAGLQP